MIFNPKQTGQRKGMPKRRTISMNLYDSNNFISMTHSSQLLYTHLLIRSDDEGYYDGINRIMKLLDIKHDSKEELIDKGFLIVFESGITLIKHWLTQNSVCKDRFHNSRFIEEKIRIYVDKNKIYQLIDNKLYTSFKDNKGAI